MKEFAEGREGCSKKEVSLEEASEFLCIIQQSEFKVMEQLHKTPARVSLLELLMSFEPHRALLVKVLNEAHVAQDIFVEGFEGIVNNITTTITSPSLKKKSSPRGEDIIGLYMCWSNAWNTL